MTTRSILWWGHSDPDYSRNRILLQVLAELGWTVRFFSPRLSLLGDVEAEVRGGARPDLVWVPCFRQRDMAAASRFCRRHRIPLVADPLISAYDKQVFERGKIAPGSRRAERLLAWEQGLFADVDRLLVDTEAHAGFFHEVLGVDRDRIVVVPVGAEESLFVPAAPPEQRPERPLEILFFGSFIPLQGPRVIVEAARSYRGPEVNWRLLGDGPLLAETRRLAAGFEAIKFEPWVPYAQLPRRIASADILLGIFGTTPKAGRVVPNKVYQAAACGRPVVTMRSGAYPEGLLRNRQSGFFWVPPGDPQALAETIRGLAERPADLVESGRAARESYETYLSVARIRRQLARALEPLGFPSGP